VRDGTALKCELTVSHLYRTPRQEVCWLSAGDSGAHNSPIATHHSER